MSHHLSSSRKPKGEHKFIQLYVILYMYVTSSSGKPEGEYGFIQLYVMSSSGKPKGEHGFINTVTDFGVNHHT